MPQIKALTFDVFGTLVDWRSCIAKESQAILSPLGIDVD
jgi:2-haloacid dehalogenase